MYTFSHLPLSRIPQVTTPAYPLLRTRDYLPSAYLPLSVTLSPNENSREHGHEFMEIVLVVSGKATHIHRTSRGKLSTYEIVENDLFIVPIGWTHGYKDTQQLTIYNILYMPSLITHDFNPESTANAASLFTGQPQRNPSGLTHKVHLRHSMRENAELMLKIIRRELMTRRHGYELLAKSRFLEFLCLLERASDDRPNDDSQARETHAVADAIRFVEDHYIRPIGLADIAQAADLNPNYLCERFGQVTGISPVKYLTRLRIEHAKGLLTTTSLPVTQVALRSGFGDSSYFARVFGRHTGKTPKAFRAESSLL
jgi:AraC-like DNA-binding protein